MKKYRIHIVSISLSVLISSVAAFRWIFDVDSMRFLGRDVLRMPFTTAVELFLIAMGYGAAIWEHIRLRSAFFGLASLIALLGLLQHIFHFLDLPESHFLMSSAACIGILAFILSFQMTFSQRSTYHAIAQFVFHGISMVAFFILLGFIFSQASESRYFFLSTMSFWSALTFLLLSVSATFVHPKLGFTGLLLGQGPGNQVTRNMFGMILSTVVVLGFIVLRMWKASLLSFDSGILLFGLLILFLTMSFMVIVARRLNQAHKQRLEADAELRRINANLEMKILERTSFLKETLEFLNETNRVASIGGWDVEVENRKVNWTAITKMIHEVPGNYEPSMDEQMGFYKAGKSRESISKALNNALSLGLSWDLELQIITAKGNERWVRSIGKPTFRNGKCVRLNGTFQDIDARRRAELQVQEESRFLQTVIDNVPVNIYAKDLESRKTLINKQELRFMGLKDFQQVLGKNDHDLFPRESADISRAEDLEIFRSRRPMMYKETSLEHKDGRKYWFLSSKIPLVNEEGEVTGLLGLSVDITERKLNEEKLKKYAVMEANSREMEQFAYVASHDLRVPLLAIKNYTELLTEEYLDQLEGDGQHFIRVIQSGVNKMEALINGLLEYSRLGMQSRQMVITDLEHLLQEVLAELVGPVTEAEAQVRIGVMPALLVFPDQIKVLFKELITNAIKFRDHHTRPLIEVQAGEESDGWLFLIRDNGIGIPANESDQVFTIFKRLNEDKEYPGIGVGLAKCKKIVEQHGGRIWVESEEGGGSIFYFSIQTEK